MKRIGFSIFVYLLIQNCFAQQLPELIDKNLSAVNLISNDWKTLTQVKGDLNYDGFDDMCVILESRDSLPENRFGNSVELNKPRIILVLLYRDGDFVVISQNNDFIARANEGGMANYIEPGITISEGILNIDYEFVRSSITYNFEYSNGDMVIKGAKSVGIHAGTGDFEINHYDFDKRQLKTVKGNVGDEEDSDLTEVFDFYKEPKSLMQFKSMFSWEILENKYL